MRTLGLVVRCLLLLCRFGVFGNRELCSFILGILLPSFAIALLGYTEDIAVGWVVRRCRDLGYWRFISCWTVDGFVVHYGRGMDEPGKARFEALEHIAGDEAESGDQTAGQW